MMRALIVNSMVKAKKDRKDVMIYLNPGYGGFGFFVWHKREKIMEFAY